MTITALNDARRQHTGTKRKALAVGLIAVTSVAYALLGPASAAHADSTVTTGTQLVTDFTTATAPTTITLGADVIVAGSDGAMEAPDNFAVTIDLAGYDLEVNAPLDSHGMVVGGDSAVDIVDSVGGGALTLIGAESSTSAAGGKPGLLVTGVMMISVDEATITGGDSGVGSAGHGLLVIEGALTVDGTDLVVTGGAGGVSATGYGAVIGTGANVAFTGGSTATITPGAGAGGSHGLFNNAGAELRITENSSLTVTATGATGSASGVANEGAIVVSNGSLVATGGTAALSHDVRNEGTLVLVDPLTFAGTIGGFYDVPFTFDGNGGTPTEVTVYAANINDGLTVLTAPTDVWPPVRSGYAFTGWFSDPTGGVEVPSDIFDDFIEVTRTVYAQWAADAAAPVDPADPAELAATGVTDSSGVVIAGSLLLVGLLTLGGAVIARRRL